MKRCGGGSPPGAAPSACQGRAPATDLRRIVWTDEALEHLEAIVTYVSVFDLGAAGRLADRLIDLADSLADYADRGRDVGLGRREMTVVWPYIMRYRVEETTVVILRIRHGARQDED